MSVLFKQKYEIETKDFDAFTHLKSLCIEFQLPISDTLLVNYQKGWGNLIRTVIFDIKKYPVKLMEVIDIGGQLEIDFEMPLLFGQMQAGRLLINNLE